MLAKLAIIAKRMPLENGKGICVLTHTNVAIDEIKSKLKNQADVLFRYPNFFGTIQNFVDKFLAIPYFNSISEVPVGVIDNDRAYAIMRSVYNSLYSTYRGKIYNAVKTKLSENLSWSEKEKQQRELGFLVAHSMLHLFGYDHMQDEEREVMEEKQRDILNMLNLKR